MVNIKTPSSYISSSRIKLTNHCRDRFDERMNIHTKEDLKKVAASARNKGVNIQALTPDNTVKLGVDPQLMKNLQHRFHKRTNSERLYYYKGYVFIFAGKDACTLKTVVKL